MEPIKSDNELIEEFWISQGGKAHMKEDLWFYESSWDMLMPVVEKISRTLTEDCDTFYPRTFGMLDADGHWMFRFNRFHLITAGTLIEAAHGAVVEFIKWYNQSVLTNGDNA